MPKAALVKRGEEYLPGVPPAELEAMYGHERPGKSRAGLQAVLRKRDELLEKIAGMMGRGVGTIHRWLSRMEREGPEGRHDNKSSGRPRLLNREQKRTIEGISTERRASAALSGSSWNGRMVARHIPERFGVPYSSRSAIGLAHRLGFSVRKPPIHPVERRHVRGAEGAHREGEVDPHQVEGRTVVAVDAATLRDSPVSRKGIRRRGGRETVPEPLQTAHPHDLGAGGRRLGAAVP